MGLPWNFDELQLHNGYANKRLHISTLLTVATGPEPSKLKLDTWYIISRPQGPPRALIPPRTNELVHQKYFHQNATVKSKQH